MNMINDSIKTKLESVFIKKNRNNILLIFLLLLIFYLYLKILYPAFAINDSPETIAGAYILGISHPPGYPLFNMLGKIFLLLKINPAFNINLFSSFLAIVNLIIIFFIIKKIYKNEKIAFLSIFTLAFSYGFLKEAIQAKGGIYILNLFYLGLIVLIIILLFDNYSLKKLYLLFFIYSLSLSNHWQTMIFFLPIIIWVLIFYYKNLKIKNYLFIIFLIIIGLSPYLYLWQRALSDAILNHGNPDNFFALIKHILRVNYIGEFENLNKSILLFQVREFINVFMNSYSILIILFFIGLFHNLNNKGKLSIILFLFFVINVLSIVIFFRRRQDSSCYYLPAIFISVIFISGGLNYFYNLKNKMIKFFLFAAILTTWLITANNNYKFLNNSKNYLSYDYINNIYKTINNNSIYIASSDFDINPIFYFKYVLKKRKDIKIIYANFLAFDWGIEQFKNDFKDFKEELETKKPGKNVIKIIEFYYNKEKIYGGYNYETLQKTGLSCRQEGLIWGTGRLIKIKSEVDYYKIYSYRGIFNKNFQKTGDSLRLISNYAGNMVNYGNEFLEKGNILKSIELYEKAIKLPFNGSKKGFYQNLIIAYKKKGDLNTALKYIKILEKLR